MKLTFRLTEEELRAWQKCSALFSFGGNVDLPYKTQIMEYVYTKLILELLKNPNFDYKFNLGLQLTYAKRHLKMIDAIGENETAEILRHTAVNINELFTLLQPNRYVPVFGTFEYPVRISNGIIDLRVASMLTTNINVERGKGGRTYHAVAFSPHTITQHTEADITQLLKVMTLAVSNPLKATSHKAPKFRLHLISTKPTSAGINYTFLEHTKDMDGRWAKQFEQVFNLIESGYQMPLTPCPFQCPFKSVCKIDPTRKKELKYE